MTAPLSPPARHWTSRLASWLAIIALLGLLLPLQRAWLPGHGALAWILDLFSHWQPGYALIWLVACVLGAHRRRRWLLLLPLTLLPWATSSRKAAFVDGPADIVISIANVNKHNHDPKPLLAWLQKSPANMVVLSELSVAYAQALRQHAFGNYAYQALQASDSPNGIGVLSDRPLRNVRVLADSLGELRIEADVEINGLETRLIAVHPKPPKSTRKYIERDRVLQHIADETQGMPVIVAGDLNATPWSSALLGMQPSHLARITGTAATYPTEGRGIIGVGIDHILISPHFAGVDAQCGPDIGSDHLPIRGALRRL